MASQMHGPGPQTLVHLALLRRRGKAEPPPRAQSMLASLAAGKDMESMPSKRERFLGDELEHLTGRTVGSCALARPASEAPGESVKPWMRPSRLSPAARPKASSWGKKIHEQSGTVSA